MPVQVQPKIYRVNVASIKLGVSRATIYRLVKSRKLILIKIGERASGITAESLDALIAISPDESSA